MNTKLILVILMLAVLASLLVANKAGLLWRNEHHEDEQVLQYEIYPGDVAKKIEDKEDFILIDVRTIEEYEEIHLQGAVLLPVQELSQTTLNNIGVGVEAKDSEIILYCRSGARSKTAYDIMKSLGYTNVKSVAGGMVHWEEDEYPYTEIGAYTGATRTTNKESVAQEGARISLDRSLHDFGVIPQYGGTVRAEFTVLNKGTKTLNIGQLTTSCSCTSASISNAELQPSESAILTVVFDPDFHGEPLGVFKRTVFIPTNDPTNSDMEVSISVDIDEGK